MNSRTGGLISAWPAVHHIITVISPEKETGFELVRLDPKRSFYHRRNFFIYGVPKILLVMMLAIFAVAIIRWKKRIS